MKYLKCYNSFSEKLNIYQNDQPNMASNKSSYNDLEENIKEFTSKKTTVDNIYATYKDDRDLISKLFAQKFIPLNTDDMNKIKFTNPLIALYAQVCDKRRELKSVEADLTTQNETLLQRQSALSQSPNTTDSIQSDIDYTKGKILDLTKRISTLKTEVSTLEKNAKDKLNAMKTELLNSKKKIDYFVKSDNNKN